MARILLVLGSIVALPVGLVVLTYVVDAPTIRRATAVDDFIRSYCASERALPGTGQIAARFPELTGAPGWFFHREEKTLTMRYPINFWNVNAIGRSRISEFTATPYAYTVDYRCD